MIAINIYQKYTGHLTARWAHLNSEGKFARDVIEEDFNFTGKELIAKLTEFYTDKYLEAVEVSTTRFVFRLFNSENNEATDIWIEIESGL